MMKKKEILKKLQKPSRKKVKSLYTYDLETGFWGTPNINCVIDQSHLLADSISVCLNEDGLRDISLKSTYKKDNIICIGGSHSWGAGLEVSLRYSNVLSESTNQNIYNFGQLSLGIDQICLAILKKSSKYNPKTIIVEQYPWAIMRILNNYVNGYLKPKFYLDNNDKLHIRELRKYTSINLLRSIMGQYQAYKKEFHEFLSGIDLSKDYDPMTDPIFLKWKGIYYDYMYKLLEKIIIVINSYCIQNKINLLFAIGAVYQQFQPPIDTKLIDYSIPRYKLKEILKNLKISYVDMTDPLLSKHTVKNPVIFHDGHINELGHKIFAQEIERKLRRLNWLS